MIKVHFKDDAHDCWVVPQRDDLQLTPGEAFRFVFDRLDYGSIYVPRVTETRVEVGRDTLGGPDLTVFTGSADELAPVFKAVAAYMALSDLRYRLAMKEPMEEVERTPLLNVFLRDTGNGYNEPIKLAGLIALGLDRFDLAETVVELRTYGCRWIALLGNFSLDLGVPVESLIKEFQENVQLARTLAMHARRDELRTLVETKKASTCGIFTLARDLNIGAEPKRLAA